MFGKEKDAPVSSKGTPTQSSTVTREEPETPVTATRPDPVTASPAQSSTSDPWEAPIRRRTIQAQDIIDDPDFEQSEDILIKAQPSMQNDQCKFTINRPVLPGLSWWFGSFESAEGSPLGQALFSIEGVETVLIHDDSITVTRGDKTIVDWKPFAEEAGSAIREVLQTEEIPVGQAILDKIPEEKDIREGIQNVIDTEVNPGVAGHGGKISLLNVVGNTVLIQMGGGCQGCSSADVTLKMGIHNAFRKAVPAVGAIYDETDHSAGINPYFS